MTVDPSPPLLLDCMTQQPSRGKTPAKRTGRPRKSRTASKDKSGDPSRTTTQQSLSTSDNEILDRSRMQWQFGDWDSLAAVDWQIIEQHPQRAELALLTSTAHQQLGDADTAKIHVARALEWGCEWRHALEVVLAGVHNTLARMAVVRHEEARALRHFRNAVSGVGGDARLACQARSVREIARLGLLDQASRALLAPSSAGRSPSEVGGPLRQIMQASARVRTPTALLNPTPAAGVPRTILVAGMRHSGSTAVFNVVRLALEYAGLRYASCYSDGTNSELLNDPDSGPLLIKTHELRDDVLMRADAVITARRDLRDTVASAKRRKFPLLERLGGATAYAKYNRLLHDVWLPYSDCEFIYESYMDAPAAEAGKVLAFLGLEVDAESVCAEVAKLPTDDYQKTLLSDTHITDPFRVLSFNDTLDESQIGRINTDHADWLRRYGYPLQQSVP